MSLANSLLLAGSLLASSLTAAQPESPKLFKGMCDASCAVGLSTNFVAVADDEDNLLRVFSIEGGKPVTTLNMSTFLRLEWKAPEADLEAAACINDRIYWLSSHGRDAEGRERVNRRQFFATRFSIENGRVSLTPIGRPYHELLRDLLRAPSLQKFNLQRASQLPPKEKDALNLEGLTATPDGSLLLGFRNPIPDGKALIVPLLNPDKLILTGGPAEFGEPFQIDLGGEGIRGMDSVGNLLLILGGPSGSRGKSALFAWVLGSSDPPRILAQPALRKLNPEAVAVLEADNSIARLFIASDDGTRLIAGSECKRLKDPNLKQFRGVTLRVDLPDLPGLKH